MSTSVLSSSNVVIYDHLSIFFGSYFYPLCIISWITLKSSNWMDNFHLGININDLPISLVLEHQALHIGCNDLKVGGGIIGWCLGFPIVEAQVSGFGQQALFSSKIYLEILCFQTMGIIDIPTDFLSFLVLVPDEDDTLEAFR